MRVDDNTARISLLMPASDDYHLEVASASHGMSKSEYIRLAVKVALSAEPVVTPEHAARMYELSQVVHGRDLVSA